MSREAIFAIVALGLALASLSANAQLSRVTADRSSIAIGGSVRDSTIIAGIPQEKVDELVRERTKPLEQLTEAQKRTIVLLEEKLDLNERQVRSALNILGERDIPPERLAAKLIEIAEKYNAIKAMTSANPGDDAKTSALRGDAQRAIDLGDLEKADALLSEVIAEQKRAHDRLDLNIAETFGKRGDIAMARLRYNEGARHFADAAAAITNNAHQDKAADYRERQADALYRQGDEFGDETALMSAIELQRKLLDMFPREKAPRDWARIQANLGLALDTLAHRASGSADVLEESVAAYRNALKEITRDAAPLDWALVQNNLGATLAELGERQNGTAKLNEAIDAYREALKERTRERTPLDWAATQANLASALLRIGMRENAVEKIADAVRAYRTALQEATRERAPSYWATIQNNLGFALDELGNRQNDPATRNEAVTAFREALKERKRERYPVDWAVTQYNLGSVLSDLAAGETEAGTLEEAVAAYRAALSELTREGAGLFWARAQTNLGNALFRLGSLETGTGALEQAVAAYREAAKEWTREKFPWDWAMEQSNIGDALLLIGERASEVEKLEQAAAAYQESFQVPIERRDPVTWATRQASYCRALWRLGHLATDDGKKAAAIGVCRRSQQMLVLLIENRDKMPPTYAHRAGNALGGLADTLIGVREYQSALDAADMVLVSFPGLGWVKINKAHALMFLGRKDEARGIYLEQGQDGKWKASVRKDFARFRELGLNVPLMKDVEQALAN